jgi:hypothetical protein
VVEPVAETDKEKAEKRKKWSDYCKRKRRMNYYKKTADKLGLLKEPKKIKFWEGNAETGKWVTGEQLCNEGIITLYQGRRKDGVKEEMQGVIVRITVNTQVTGTMPVETSRIKLGDRSSNGKYTILVGKSEQPAVRLTGRVLFPNSTEPKVRIVWFGNREEWMVESQVVFSEEVIATERKKKVPERLADLQQQTKEGEVLGEGGSLKMRRRRIVNILKEHTISSILMLWKPLLPKIFRKTIRGQLQRSLTERQRQSAMIWQKGSTIWLTRSCV